MESMLVHALSTYRLSLKADKEYIGRPQFSVKKNKKETQARAPELKSKSFQVDALMVILRPEKEAWIGGSSRSFGVSFSREEVILSF